MSLHVITLRSVRTLRSFDFLSRGFFKGGLSEFYLLDALVGRQFPVERRDFRLYPLKISPR